MLGEDISSHTKYLRCATSHQPESVTDGIASVRVGVEVTRGHDGLKSAVLVQAELVVLRYLR